MRRVLVTAWFIVILIGSAVTLVVNWRTDLSPVVYVMDAMFPLVLSALGTLLLWKGAPRSIGLALLATGFGGWLEDVTAPFVAEAPVSVGLLEFLAVVGSNVGWAIIFFPLFYLLVVFPTGELPSPRWRWVPTLCLSMGGFLLFLVAFGAQLDDIGGTWAVENPIGFVEFGLDGPLAIPWVIGLFSLVGAGPTALVRRYRRAGAVVRAQIRWVLFAAGVFAVGYVYVLSTYLLRLDGPAFGDHLSQLEFAAFTLSTFLIPAAMTAAILRYRLFEIDRLISRTVGYLLVIGLLGAAYFAVLYLLGSVLPFESDLAVAASTLIVVGLFNPVRRRIQGSVDRRFFRSRYDAVEVVRSFTGRLSGPMDGERLAGELEGVLDTTMRPEAVGVWIRGDS